MVSAIIYPGLDLPSQRLAMLSLVSPADEGAKTARAISKICTHFDITPIELKSPKRYKHLVMARAILCNYLRHKTHFTLKKCGDILGGRDHSTVIYCLNLYNDLEQFDKLFQKHIKEIKL